MDATRSGRLVRVTDLRPPPGRFRQVLAGAYGGLPRAFWVQWTGMLANRLGTFVQPFLALYLTVARGLTIAQAGVILVIYGVGSLIGPLLGGLLADHLNRRVALGGSMVVSAATLMALGAASTTPTIAITAFAAGMAADLYRPASGALIADIVPVSQRARAYGLLFWANNLGFAVGAMAGGWLAERGYGLLFVLDAATCLVFGALIFFATKTNTRPKPAAHEPAVGYRTALRDPLLLGMLGLTALYATIYTQADVTLPLTMHGAGLSAASYGIALAVNGVLIVVLQPFATAWLSRFNQMRVQAASGALLGVGFGLTALAHSQWAFVGSVVVWTIGELGYRRLRAVPDSRSRPDHRARPLPGAFQPQPKLGVHSRAGRRHHCFERLRAGRPVDWLPGQWPGAGRRLPRTGPPSPAPASSRHPDDRGHRLTTDLSATARNCRTHTVFLPPPSDRVVISQDIGDSSASGHR
ncbi:MFS transporter [Fodinicola feengrottensis]|uniref:MFS transporter n=1 Tax=Fodinicola feengrottensis TaxID=435914 RepID=UPI00244192E9|nr:MFS transporter [Fodinicola feengrottensis]